MTVVELNSLMREASEALDRARRHNADNDRANMLYWLDRGAKLARRAYQEAAPRQPRRKQAAGWDESACMGSRD